MKLLGFNFTKLDLEKKSDNFKNLKLSTNINVLEIKELNSSLFNSSEKLIGIKFEYILNYEENIASLKFYGDLLISVDSTQSKEILEKWKEKKLPEKFKIVVFNLIFKKANLKALKFEEELNLPPHLPMPSFKSDKK